MDASRSEITRVSALINRAEVLIDLGRSIEALPLLQEAIALAPDDAAPHGWLALALHHCGRNAEALKYAEQCATRAPDWEWPHRLRGIILLAQRKVKEATAAALTAVQLAPNDRDPLHLLANCQMSARRFADARATAERLSAVAPDWDFTHNLFGSLAGYQRRWKESEQHSRQALELNPESKAALHNLGNALRQTGRKREASECYHRILVIDPSDAEVRRELLTLVSWDMAELPIWKRKQRLHEEHPAVQAFVTASQEKEQREAIAAMWVIWLILGWFFTVGWTLLIIVFAGRGGLLHQWWEWASYLTVVGATLYGTIHYLNRKRGEPR